MRIDIISAVPELLESPFHHSILKRAHQKGLLEVQVHNLRDYTPYPHKQIDDYQFGGGAGMVMMPEPLAILLDKLKTERTYDEVIFMTPDGKKFDQKMANTLSLKNNFIIICGHYKGIDERIRQHYVTLELTVGDYVLSGGELPAAIFVDAIGRLLPGVLNDETSALTDSFQDNLLAPPVFTRPAEFRGWKVPDELLTGNPKIVEEWRYQQSMQRTQDRRPDLLNDTF